VKRYIYPSFLALAPPMVAAAAQGRGLAEPFLPAQLVLQSIWLLRQKGTHSYSSYL